MSATIELCSWNNIFPYELDQSSVLEEVAGEFIDDYDLEQATEDFIDAINQQLEPYGAVFCGTLLITHEDQEFEEMRDIVHEIVGDIDVFEILERNAID